MKIESLEQIDKIKVHWSESNLINDYLGCDENSDIEKEICAVDFDDMIKLASQLVDTGFDKTMLSVYLKDGTLWADEVKFYLSEKTPDLLSLLNRYE